MFTKLPVENWHFIICVDFLNFTVGPSALTYKLLQTTNPLAARSLSVSPNSAWQLVAPVLGLCISNYLTTNASPVGTTYNIVRYDLV